MLSGSSESIDGDEPLLPKQKKAVRSGTRWLFACIFVLTICAVLLRHKSPHFEVGVSSGPADLEMDAEIPVGKGGPFYQLIKGLSIQDTHGHTWGDQTCSKRNCKGDHKCGMAQRLWQALLVDPMFANQLGPFVNNEIYQEAITNKEQVSNSKYLDLILAFFDETYNGKLFYRVSNEDKDKDRKQFILEAFQNKVDELLKRQVNALFLIFTRQDHVFLAELIHTENGPGFVIYQSWIEGFSFNYWMDRRGTATKIKHQCFYTNYKNKIKDHLNSKPHQDENCNAIKASPSSDFSGLDKVEKAKRNNWKACQTEDVAFLERAQERYGAGKMMSVAHMFELFKRLTRGFDFVRLRKLGKFLDFDDLEKVIAEDKASGEPRKWTRELGTSLEFEDWTTRHFLGMEAVDLLKIRYDKEYDLQFSWLVNPYGNADIVDKNLKPSNKKPVNESPKSTFDLPLPKGNESPKSAMDVLAPKGKDSANSENTKDSSGTGRAENGME